MSWEEDGTILAAIPPGEIIRIPDAGGEPEVLVSAESGEFVQGPSLLPGGDWLLDVTFIVGDALWHAHPRGVRLDLLHEDASASRIPLHVANLRVSAGFWSPAAPSPATTRPAT